MLQFQDLEGAGNCPLELLFRIFKNPKYKQMPVLEFIENYIVDLEKNLTGDIVFLI